MNEAAVGGPQDRASPQRVDIVDDDASVRRALGRLLNSVELRSHGYSSARAYIESIDKDGAACVLLDIHLPEISGIELLEHLGEVAPNLPVICMTGRDGSEIERRARTAGARACLRKPFDESELFDAISKAADITIPHGAGQTSVRRGAERSSGLPEQDRRHPA